MHPHGARRERCVQIMNRGVRFHRAPHAVCGAGNYANACFSIRRCECRDIGYCDVMIARCRHLVACGQIDPNLKPVHTPTLSHDLFTRYLGVDHTGARRHPRHVTVADHTDVALRIGVDLSPERM